MDQLPQISVLLAFQNQRDEVEPSLTALFELETIPLEVIIIDDGSSDGTGQAIHSLLDYYEYDHAYYFEHEEPTGRGSCLNEALQQASTSIIWAPRSMRSVDEKKLQNAITQMRNGSAPCLTQGIALPADFNGWAQRISQGNLPRDGNMLWNTDHIPSHKQFFNPFLQNHHSTDWLLRLNLDAMTISQSFYKPSEFEADLEVPAAARQELLMTLLRRPGRSTKEREMLTQLLLDLPAINESPLDIEKDRDLLKKANRLKLEGQLSAALECVEELLENEPGNADAKHLKIKLLERKRRFVEASELKHELQTDAKPHKTHTKLDSGTLKSSLIIPTALYGKPALEHCLVSIDEYCNVNTTELIIIDNASLDDTHDYLEDLKEKNFFNINLITNHKNRGFAASINQGLEAAQGEYACILHNDVELNGPAITILEELMDHYPDYALMGPLADSTLNPDQRTPNKDLYDEEVVKVDYLDSFCMMIRMDADLRLDEEYTLAFFDDIDICFEARNKGYKVGITPDVNVLHHYGTTTFALDLDTESDLYWKNIAYFNEKWDIETYSEEELKSQKRFDQLLTLDKWVNPLYPENAIKQKFKELWTDEMKTEIMKSEHDEETLMHLVHLLMVMEKRHEMRQLEDRLEDAELPAALIYEIVRFYFNRNVYSRCQHYLKRLTGQQESLQSELYRLAILIDEKKMDEAVPLLTELLDHAPSNPLLYKLAGDIHSFQGNKQEAESFYSLAHQINPFDFTETQKEIQLNS